MSYLIESSQVKLRYFREEDMGLFHEYRNNPEVAEFQSWPLPFTKQHALQFFLKMKDRNIYTMNAYIQLIIENDEEKVIGDLAFKAEDNQAEFGITIIPSYQRKGYGKSALNLLLELLFERLKFHRVTGITDTENEGSVRLMTSVGMRKEGNYIQSYFDPVKGEWRDEYSFAILASEFLNSKSNDFV